MASHDIFNIGRDYTPAQPRSSSSKPFEDIPSEEEDIKPFVCFEEGPIAPPAAAPSAKRSTIPRRLDSTPPPKKPKTSLPKVPPTKLTVEQVELIATKLVKQDKFMQSVVTVVSKVKYRNQLVNFQITS